MTIQRMDNVAIVVDDLDAAVAFFTELGMELEGKGQVEGLYADRTVGLDGVRTDIAMMRTPDGHSKLELTKYHTPAASRATVPNSSARWRSTRVPSGSATSAAPRASSSPWPNRSADASLPRGNAKKLLCG
jgi:catechol 2,3-dioxygenase-like lactoylglutathione lyase family enzyme